MKVFCFPCAGGSAIAYAKWKKYSNESLEIVPVELPGRGSRFSEDLCDDMEELVDKLFIELSESFSEEEYMLFGHSMGSLIAFNLADKVVREGIRQPSSLFFSGRRSPDIVKEEEVSYKMDDETFMKSIYEMGGTPKEVIDNEQLCSIFTPILKSDYKLVETYKYKNNIKPFNCDITIINGTNDNIIHEEKIGWRKFTRGKFEIFDFEGGHFYINDYGEEIVKIMKKKAEEIKLKLVLSGM